MELEIEWKRLREVLDRFAEYFINKAKDNLLQGNHNATGNLVNSMVTHVEINDLHYEVTVELADYWKWVDEGRKPTTGGGNGIVLEKIREWIKVKGIMPQVRPIQLPNGRWVERMPTVEGLAYAITQKIHNEGYEGTNFFTDAKNDAIRYFRESIELAIDEDIAEYVSTHIADIGNIFE